MHNHVFHNGRILPIGDIRLSPGQAGLLNGWGIFTTLRIYGGIPFAFDRHWVRLETDAARIGLPLPLGPEATRAGLTALLGANVVGEGAARIYFVLNRAGFWCSRETFPQVDAIFTTSDLPPRAAAVRLTVMPHGRHAASPLCGTKVTSWLHNVWSLKAARDRGFDEVILLNERGEAAECTSANLFCVREGSVVTPPLSSGCLAGVTRAVLLESSGDAGVPIEEAVLSPHDLRSAEEVFVTSTTREVCPVAALEDQPLPAAGTITTRLQTVFANRVAQDLSR